MAAAAAGGTEYHQLDQGAQEAAPAIMSFREHFPFSMGPASAKGRGLKGTSKNMKLAAALTCLQFTFALYATFLLYFMSPTVDLMAGPDISWASQIARQWRELVAVQAKHVHADGHGRGQGLPNSNQDSPALTSLPHHALVPNSTSEPHRKNARHLPPERDDNTKEAVCEFQEIEFTQKKSNDTKMVAIKRDVYQSILEFQMQRNGPGGAETLAELLALPSTTRTGSGLPISAPAKITVILNHFKRRTLCSQLDALLRQTLPFHSLWVLAFGSPRAHSLHRIVQTYNDTRISFMGSSYDFKYYGRFQLALQAADADFIYILDDDMIPGRRVLQILAHVAGTDKYHNSVLGSIGRILPFRQKDYSFPSYRKYGSREAGLYLPDPAYGIVVERMTQVDFLSSSWFLPAHLVKALFIETPFTFVTGEDLHLSYQLQKYRDAYSYVLPIDHLDKETWGDSEHRLAYVAETTVIHKDIVQIRDEQWWRAMSRGYITQWARMHPQQSDALFFVNTLEEARDLAPLILKFRSTPGKKAFVVVSGGQNCPCEETAAVLGWSLRSCHDRRFKIFDLEVGSIAYGTDAAEIAVIQEVYAGVKGLLQIHSPTVLFVVADLAVHVRQALGLAIIKLQNVTTLVQLPRQVVRHALWIADIRPAALRQWNQMKISINIITQNRPSSLLRLLHSLQESLYLGDEVALSFNMDSGVDAHTLRVAHSFPWPHGPKAIRRRIIPGGLIRAVSESWYPASDHEFGLLLEDDIEVSPFFYMWLKYALLAYHYDPAVILPELNSIALYTPRVVEVVKERPRWNGTQFFNSSTPYLHQLPCSWGALFFPRHWREFYRYMGQRFTIDPKQNPVQIPRSRTNGWQASWKKFLIDLMYLRGYVTLYPNFHNQTSFSTNHMEPGAHINASDNRVPHLREDFQVPLLTRHFVPLLPQARLPAAPVLPVLNLFNQLTSLKGLKAAGAKLGQDVIPCQRNQVVTVDHITGEPIGCTDI